MDEKEYVEKLAHTLPDVLTDILDLVKDSSLAEDQKTELSDSIKDMMYNKYGLVLIKHSAA